MKTANIVWIIVLLSVLLVLSGCGKDAEPEAGKDVVVEDVAHEEQGVTAEPELPEEAPEDIGGDVTEEEVAPEEPQGPEEEAGAEEAVAGEEEAAAAEEEGGEDLSAQNYKVISLKDLHAYPEEMTITVGTTVEWRNVNDNLQHIIGWSGQKQMGVKPEPILQGESWSYTFESPGKIVWFSTARPTVQGTIYVEE
jgi:plastocyanin